MISAKTIASVCAAVAAAVLVTAPADARPPQKKQVCKFEKHHGKRVKVCHWVRR